MLNSSAFGQGLKDFKLSEALSKGGDYVYGSYCGIAGQHPAKRIEAEKLIAAKDLVALSGWLNGPNLVLQTYAAEAFIRMSGTMEISDKDMARVDVIRNKENEINTCRGCIYDNMTIKECLEGIEPEVSRV